MSAASRERLRRSLSWLAVWLPAGLAAAYAVALATTFSSVRRAVYLNSDAASPLYIAEQWRSIPKGASVTLGYLPWYSTLWFELVTRRLPFHRALWELGPWVAALLAVVLVGWTLARVAGREPAALFLFLALCAGPALLRLQMVAVLHGVTVVATCVFGSYLAFLTLGEGRIGSSYVHWPLALVVGVLGAGAAASDHLFYLAGLLPFVAAAALVASRAAARTRSRLIGTIAPVVLISFVGALIAAHEMEARDIRAAAFPVHLTRMTAIPHKGLVFVESIAQLFNGDFGGARLDFHGALKLVAGLAVVAALILAARRSRSWLAPTHESPARTALLSFWWFTATLTAAGFILTTAASQVSNRYVVAAAYGVVILAAVALQDARKSIRSLAWLVACCAVAGSIAGLVGNDLTSHAVKNQEEFLPTLETLVSGERLGPGYASYWDAAALSWLSRGKVQLYPVVSCRRGLHGYCANPFHTVSSWYAPRRQVRSYLLVDNVYGPDPPLKRLGGPDEVLSFGPYSVYVYKYDIGSTIAA